MKRSKYFSLFIVVVMTIASFAQGTPADVKQQNVEDDTYTELVESANQVPAPLEVWLDDLSDTPWDDSWSAYFKSVRRAPAGVLTFQTHELKPLSITLQKNQDLMIHIKNVTGVTFVDQGGILKKVGGVYFTESPLNFGGWNYYFEYSLPLDLDEARDVQSGNFYFKNDHAGKMELTFLYTVKPCIRYEHEKLNRKLIDVTTE